MKNLLAIIFGGKRIKIVSKTPGGEKQVRYKQMPKGMDQHTRSAYMGKLLAREIRNY